MKEQIEKPTTERQLQKLISKWTAIKDQFQLTAQKCKAHGNENGYKENMSYSFGFSDCISDLENLLKQQQ